MFTKTVSQQFKLKYSLHYFNTSNFTFTEKIINISFVAIKTFENKLSHPLTPDYTEETQVKV